MSQQLTGEKQQLDGSREETANQRQIGGRHYKSEIEHWDWVAANNLDYFQGQITKYVARWKNKGGLQDLEKARHFLDKYIELNSRVECNCGAMDNPTAMSHIPGCPAYREPFEGEATRNYVIQD